MATPRKDPRHPERVLDDIRSHKFRRLLTEEWLAPRWNGGTPICEIAREAGCCTSTILRYVSRFGLLTRPPRKGHQGWDEVLTPEFLEAAYVEDRMSVEQIAADVGTTAGTVSRWLINYGIPRRGHEPGIDNLLYEDILTAEFLERRLDGRASVNTIAGMRDARTPRYGRPWAGTGSQGGRPRSAHPIRPAPRPRSCGPSTRATSPSKPSVSGLE